VTYWFRFREKSYKRSSLVLALGVAGLGISFVMSGCRSTERLPRNGSAAYIKFISAFYQGLAALQVGDDVRADSSLSAATQLAPGEPASWVNWGVLALRQRSYEAAAERLQRAHTLAPDNDQIDYVLGLLESERGNSAAAITDFQQAVTRNPRNLKAVYSLAAEIDRQGDPGSDERFQQLMQQILAVDPGNLAALLELSRVAAKRGDAKALHESVEKIGQHSGDWPPQVKQQVAQLQTAAASPDLRSAATRSVFLRNVLMQVPAFRNDLSDLKAQPGEGAQPMTHLLRLANPSARPAAADPGLSFTPTTAGVSTEAWTWAGVLYPNGDDAPVLAQANNVHLLLANGASLPFPSAGDKEQLSADSVLPVDFNYDFKTDIVLAGGGGVRFFRQDSPSHFTDVSGTTKLPTNVLNANYTGAWALDIEADGDLDILLGSHAGSPTLLRNNGDGTFATTHPFSGMSGLKQLVWADLNGDGNPDAAMIDDSGRLHVFLNQRSGNFAETSLPALLGVKAITVADLGDGSALDLVVVKEDGNISSVFAEPDGKTWSTKQIANVPDAQGVLDDDVRLLAADLDNNGAVDLLLSSSKNQSFLWLQNASGLLQPQTQTISERVFAAGDLKSDGRLSLVGLTQDARLAVAKNRGTKDYHWQIIRPRAKVATGDQRINSFGVGGEIEIRAGLLTQKQPMNGPSLHFGLGDAKQADVARIFWPNGSVRAEFNLKADQQIVTEQRLKGSCPFLFAWDGHEMNFVKDSVPWGSAIGLRINALGSAKIAATEEWYKIGRDQLVARDGYYDLRVTGELWETYYYDSMALMAVDHPEGTEIFTDERFDVPAVKLAVTEVDEPQPVISATDDNGDDVTAIVNRLDGRYLDNFGRGQYQGVTRDHYVEVELPQTLPAGGPTYLIAKGWLHPSDSSVNIAMSQGSAPKPEWLRLEVPDGHGGWRVAKPNLGFPAGRNKICVFDMTGVFTPGTPHRLRLRTNLEVYWDQIQWAQGMRTGRMNVQRMLPELADLHYRGFSTIRQADMSSPEIPDYNHLSGTTQRWRDLEGYYTRFGDVRELLAGIDDRYVIMNAGDEMSLSFAAPPPPPKGWVRDFVLAGDGWIKDGDYNSSYSQTVLPYPYHARRDYDSPPGSLQDDWVYKHHREDWQTYHTRYITAQAFKESLVIKPQAKGKAGQ
jgi:tetratricopeptide (TPR) repeat protein